MSVLHPESDITREMTEVRFGPCAETGMRVAYL